MGLNISKLLVEAMGGKIWVESEVGRGSTFHLELELPPARVEAQDSPAQKSSRRLPTPADTAPTPRILVAEDNDDNFTLLRQILMRAGFVVERAENGGLALAQAKQKRYDIVLMDLEMPEVDGFTATRLLRTWERESGTEAVPIIALTAHGMSGYRDRCMDEGMNDFLVKPIIKEQLLDTVWKWVDRRPLVLVVDDSADMRKLVQRHLERTGAYRLSAAGDGEEAIRAFEKLRPSLILLDMEMSRMDGFATAGEIRQNPQGRSVPIVAMTGHAEAKARRRCLDAGCTGYLEKPFSREKLLEIVEKHLGGPRNHPVTTQKTDEPLGR